MQMSEEQFQAHVRKNRKTSNEYTLIDNGKGRFKREVPVRSSVPRPRHENGRMNQTEAAYARLLEGRLLANEIAGWWYELMTIKLADRCSLQPDFMVMLLDGSLEFHEVKGGKTDGNGKWTYWAEEDAKVKLKIAAAITPFPLFVVYPQKGGHKNGWCVVEMRGE